MRFHSSSACWSELVGGKVVPLFAYAPDPDSSHDDFYYNTTENQLYRLEDVHDPCSGVRRKSWEPVRPDSC